MRLKRLCSLCLYNYLWQVLGYVATLLDMSKEELAELSFRNAVTLFSYEGSKLQTAAEV